MDARGKSLRELVEEARDMALAGDVAACHSKTVELLGEGYSIDQVVPAMHAADPERVVWYGPIATDAVGARGWPMIEARYKFYSDVYGHEVRLPPQFLHDEDAERFIEDAEDGYERCLLHDRGFVAVDERADKLGFLVTVGVDEDEELDETAFADVGARYGVQVATMAWAHTPLEGGGSPSRAVLTAFVEDRSKFGIVNELSCAIQETLRPNTKDIEPPKGAKA